MQRAAAARVGANDVRCRTGSPPRLRALLTRCHPRFLLWALVLALLSGTGGGSSEERAATVGCAAGISSDPLKPFADLLLRNSGSGGAWMPGHAIVVPDTHPTINDAIQAAGSPDVRPLPPIALSTSGKFPTAYKNGTPGLPFQARPVWCTGVPRS